MQIWLRVVNEKVRAILHTCCIEVNDLDIASLFIMIPFSKTCEIQNLHEPESCQNYSLSAVHFFIDLKKVPPNLESWFENVQLIRIKEAPVMMKNFLMNCNSYCICFKYILFFG